jgi:HAD superfamily hydrolase (TIGR01509 family)
VDAVLFDLDDTLVNWREAEAGAIKDLAAAHFEPRGVATAEVERVYAGVMAENVVSFRATQRWWYVAERLTMLTERLGTAAAVPGDLLGGLFRERVRARLALLPGAVEALAAARAGRKVALLTNGPSEVQRPKVEQFGLATLVDFVGISGELGHWKPSPEAFLAVCRQLGVAPSRAVMVGDSEDFDMLPAKALGMQTARVGRDPQPTCADVAVSVPAELVPLLRGNA